MSEAQTQVTAPVTKAPDLRTPYEKLVDKANALAKKSAEIAEQYAIVKSEIDTMNALAAIDVGSVVIISVGKKGEETEVEAKVLGKQEADDGVKFKVIYGSGLDTEVDVILPKRIKRLVSALIDGGSAATQ